MEEVKQLENWHTQDNPRSGMHLIGEVEGVNTATQLDPAKHSGQFNEGEIIETADGKFKLGTHLYEKENKANETN